jgi:hypothetical protein
MGKAGKTMLQVSMREYGAQQTTIRRMSREDQDRYSTPGTPGHSRHLARVAEQVKRAQYREKAIKEFDKNEPLFGSFKDCVGDPGEQVAMRSAVTAAWKTERAAFLKALDLSHPAIKY